VQLDHPLSHHHISLAQSWSPHIPCTYVISFIFAWFYNPSVWNSKICRSIAVATLYTITRPLCSYWYTMVNIVHSHCHHHISMSITDIHFTLPRLASYVPYLIHQAPFLSCRLSKVWATCQPLCVYYNGLAPAFGNFYRRTTQLHFTCIMGMKWQSRLKKAATSTELGLAELFLNKRDYRENCPAYDRPVGRLVGETGRSEGEKECT
jgi:hypothetical protein